MEISVDALMAESGVKFGTSGARGLAADMTDLVCFVYTRAFLQYLASIGDIEVDSGSVVAIAGDLRPSTDRIMESVCRAASDFGCRPVNFGKIPSPAISLYGIQKNIPAIMVTGSHIPDDRNGIKFNKCSGEILKKDEEGIRAQIVQYDAENFSGTQSFTRQAEKSFTPENDAEQMYRQRYLDFFPSGYLDGMTIGVYQHSAVGRDLLSELMETFGATTTRLARSDVFIPVDTEAIRPEDVQLAKQWSREHGLDAIVSTDGDSDRPLIADERGNWIRGDVSGILCAKYLGADTVCLPVSCNSAVEKCGWFDRTRKTRIGSPYVIEAMIDAEAQGASKVVGYEANGGFLTQSDITLEGRRLPALPTRDAFLPIFSLLHLAKTQDRSLSELVATLPPRFTESGRLKNFPLEKSAAILSRFSTGNFQTDRSVVASVFGNLAGKLVDVDRTDGVRMTFENGEVIHLRPSGNAPEFRCYNEAESKQRARQLNEQCLKFLSGL